MLHHIPELQRESPSSPYNKTSSDDHKDGSDSDGGGHHERTTSSSSNGLNSLERLRQICNKTLMPSLVHHDAPGLLDTSMEGDLDGSHGFHCHLCSFSCMSRDEFNDHVNDHYEFRCQVIIIEIYGNKTKKNLWLDKII